MKKSATYIRTEFFLLAKHGKVVSSYRYLGIVVTPLKNICHMHPTTLGICLSTLGSIYTSESINILEGVQNLPAEFDWTMLFRLRSHAQSIGYTYTIDSP